MSSARMESVNTLWPANYPPALVAYALFERRAGRTLRDIAEEVNVSPATAFRWCARFNIYPTFYRPYDKTNQPERPAVFRTITVEDWKRNLAAARERRKDAPDRMADEIIRNRLRVKI